ncbi:hypothetical protein EV421DRAFT_1729832 [Armillaria borealis]|uniref:Uncharacterized protein n=1 Tax=Armillaria borealis TaxID=47425 RepID=A0AA39K767_9AGAR|nr:hypothetical protein EV421DRAFT_1729832 [Armillaria borealis]
MTHEEEVAQLLQSSHSSNDLALPTAFPQASKSPPTKRIRLSGPPLTVTVLLLAVTFTVFWINNSSNALSALVQWLCAASVRLERSLDDSNRFQTRQIWWSIRPMQLNHIFGLPNPIRTLRLASSERPWKILPIITMATVVQVYTLVSILAPNSLEVGTASVQSELISIPTIVFNTDPPEHSWGYVPADSCDYALSSGWERTLGQSLQSDELIGWKAPLRCGTPAPALRCFDLGPDEIFDNDESHQDILWSYCGPPLPTYSLDFRTADIAMAWRTYNASNESAASGQSTVSFVNNTGIISPRILSYNDPYASFDIPTPKCNESGPIRNSSSSVEAYHISYFAIANWLFKQLSGSIDYVHVGPQGWDTKTEVMMTDLFSLNDTARTFSENTVDIKGTLERMLVNATVALIRLAGDTTTVDAAVARDLFVWVYDAHRLWITYSITALGMTFVCGVLGLVCIMRNGEAGDVSFLDIAKATRNTELDDVFGEWVDEDTRDRSILQYGICRRMDGLDTSRIFRLVKTHQTDKEHGPA